MPVLKRSQAFLNTEGGDLIIGVNDTSEVVGIELDQFDNSGQILLHLGQVVRNPVLATELAPVSIRAVQKLKR